jgi:hypothetical protein
MVYSRSSKKIIKNAYLFAQRNNDDPELFGAFFFGSLVGKVKTAKERKYKNLDVEEALAVASFIQRKFLRRR